MLIRFEHSPGSLLSWDDSRAYVGACLINAWLETHTEMVAHGLTGPCFSRLQVTRLIQQDNVHFLLGNTHYAYEEVPIADEAKRLIYHAHFENDDLYKKVREDPAALRWVCFGLEARGILLPFWLSHAACH